MWKGCLGKERKYKLDKVKFGDNLRIGIGDVSKMTGVSTRQLRYWEQKGYIKPINENEGSARKYGLGAMYKIFAIKQFLDEGFTLAKSVEKAERRGKEGVVLHRFIREMVLGIEMIDEEKKYARLDFGCVGDGHLYGVVDEKGIRFELKPLKER